MKTYETIFVCGMNVCLPSFWYEMNKKKPNKIWSMNGKKNKRELALPIDSGAVHILMCVRVWIVFPLTWNQQEKNRLFRWKSTLSRLISSASARPNKIILSCYWFGFICSACSLFPHNNSDKIGCYRNWTYRTVHLRTYFEWFVCSFGSFFSVSVFCSNLFFFRSLSESLQW